jgi:mRNA interferase MazF
MTIKAGDVILTPFPFRDKAAESTRPAVVLFGTSYSQQGDVVVAAITSHPPRLSTDYALQDWKAANLVKPSTVRMLLATIDQTRIVLTIGHLTDRDWQGVQATLQLVFA